MSQLPVTDLADTNAEVRLKACNAIADAVDAGAPLGTAAKNVIAVLGDANSSVRGLALYILQTEAERHPSGGTVEACALP